MEIVGTAQKVTIYIGESDRWGQKPLYMAILEMLKSEDCAGATVTRGLAGFGAHSRIKTARIVDLSSDLPLEIVWVDDPARIARVMPRLTEMVAEGLITCEEVEVIAYGYRELRALRTSTPVHDIMRREVQSVAPDMPVADAVEMLIGKPYRALPVTDENRRVVGILTDGDLLARLGLPNASIQRELSRTELRRQFETLRAGKQIVQDLMTTPVFTVMDETPVAEAVRLMTQRGIKRLPVVDREGRLVGMVSRLDVLRALAQPVVKAMPEQEVVPGRYSRVGEIMLANAPTVPADAPLNVVVDLLVSAGQRRVVVVDSDRRVMGIITDGDLLQRSAETERPDLLRSLAARMSLGSSATLTLAPRTAADVMTRNPVTTTPEAELLDALRLLLDHRVKRLPVVDREGRLVGIIGRGEILRALAQDV